MTMMAKVVAVMNTVSTLGEMQRALGGTHHCRDGIGYVLRRKLASPTMHWRIVGTSPEGHEEACATTYRRRGSRPLLGTGVLNRGSVA